MPKTEYHQMDESDFEGIRRVALESWRVAYGDIHDQDYITSTVNTAYSGESLRKFRARITAGDAFFEVAVRDGEVLGFIVVANAPEVSRCYILPDYFGGRLAYTLYKHAEDYVKSIGYDYICSTVEKRNERAVKFNTRLGGRTLPYLETEEHFHFEKTFTFWGRLRRALVHWRGRAYRALGLASRKTSHS